LAGVEHCESWSDLPFGDIWGRYAARGQYKRMVGPNITDKEVATQKKYEEDIVSSEGEELRGERNPRKKKRRGKRNDEFGSGQGINGKRKKGEDEGRGEGGRPLCEQNNVEVGGRGPVRLTKDWVGDVLVVLFIGGK